MKRTNVAKANTNGKTTRSAAGASLPQPSMPAPSVDPTDHAASAATNGGQAAAPLPRIEPEPDDTIHVAAGGKLVVPREDHDADLDDGAELDLVSGMPPKI